ncbi:MAG: hypothetical protein ACI9R3_004549 [Verrucomicrobiales bacterium]|jgi:hypothetical protein
MMDLHGTGRVRPNRRGRMLLDFLWLRSPRQKFGWAAFEPSHRDEVVILI